MSPRDPPAQSELPTTTAAPVLDDYPFSTENSYRQSSIQLQFQLLQEQQHQRKFLEKFTEEVDKRLSSIENRLDNLENPTNQPASHYQSIALCIGFASLVLVFGLFLFQLLEKTRGYVFSKRFSPIESVRNSAFRPVPISLSPASSSDGISECGIRQRHVGAPSSHGPENIQMDVLDDGSIS